MASATIIVTPSPKDSCSSNDLWTSSDWTTMDEDDDEDMIMMVVVDGGETLSATSHQEASKVLEEWQSDNSVVESAAAPVVVVVSPSTTVFAMNSPSHSAAAVSDNDEDDEDLPEDIQTLMEVDEEIGSNFLDEEVFGGAAAAVAAIESPPIPASFYCSSPTGPLEEFDGYYCSYGCSAAPIIDENDDRFLAPLLDEDDHDAIVMALDSVLVEVITTQNINFDPNAPFDEKRYQQVHEKLAECMKKTQETRKCLTMKNPKTEKYSRSKTVKGVISSIEKSSRQLEKYLQSVQKAMA
ncbi:hypothetical protein IV203_016311 [Nitzschia inconspicua]|uniref:Uncharacterized protein n=1 Tax=Nitzschia inconspicua TaxID=303405 RepID=A0A9K3PI49_9STRA|nr:hypothetical protein IV203_016311 [Nitzschia inconspicua]